jgi:ketosteroid isomerase-like protein
MQWLESARARDLDAVTALFADDAVFFDEGEGSIEGVPAIRADIESDWAEYPDAAITWSTNSVEVASSGDMAWERGTWTFDPDGAGEAGEMTGEYVTIYKKVGDTWKVASDFGVTNEPADMDDMDDSGEAEM